MLIPVLFTAQENKDVFEDNERFRTIDSTRNQFKVGWSGKETFSLNSSNNYSWTKTVTHNLGYKPQAICYAYFAEANESLTAMVKVEKFTLIPYAIGIGTEPLSADFVASIEKSTSTVKFKFYQDDGWKQGDQNPQFYTLTNMKMFYLVFIEEQ